MNIVYNWQIIQVNFFLIKIMRIAKIERITKETSINAEINLDGSGIFEISTGIGFLDHMIEQFSKHSLIDIKLQAVGDLHIDYHHTTEDSGWCLGQAFARAIGDKAGINRFAHSYVGMDEALSRVVVDISGRPYITWKVNFSRDKLGEMDTELFKEWFQAFSQSAGITLHVENLYGENNHHIIESCYKALARSVKDAIALDPRKSGIIPSTKGVLGGSL